MEKTIEEKRDLFYQTIFELGKKYNYTPHDILELIKCRINDDKTDFVCNPFPIETNVDFLNEVITLYNTLFRGGMLLDHLP